MTDDVHIEWIGGNCPVQAEGSIDGESFYFRARGEHWRIGIGGKPVLHPDWGYEEDYGDGPYDAGWMDVEEARAFIAKAVAMYRAHVADAGKVAS